ncbi:denn domain-containing protein [Anaeramoeba flamelloides]|uniref:Denn domain-containing protein n=1 Tax=Anaeramoeba flamelloides TaxID=1746091 RepID=A0AAV7YJI7_9EUKA|nr:denn domain-containing protein [Anaeramoeba flamelloides]
MKNISSKSIIDKFAILKIKKGETETECLLTQPKDQNFKEIVTIDLKDICYPRLKKFSSFGDSKISPNLTDPYFWVQHQDIRGRMFYCHCKFIKHQSTIKTLVIATFCDLIPFYQNLIDEIHNIIIKSKYNVPILKRFLVFVNKKPIPKPPQVFLINFKKKKKKKKKRKRKKKKGEENGKGVRKKIKVQEDIKENTKENTKESQKKKKKKEKKTKIKTNFALKGKMRIQNPLVNDHFISKKGIYDLFKKFKPRTFLSVFAALLFEERIILVSNTSLNFQLIPALIGIMYPLRWSRTIIPYLPITKFTLLTKKIPYLVGVYSSHYRYLNKLKLPPYCLVDLDKGTIQYRQKALSNVNKLPERETTTLASNLSLFKKKNISKKSNDKLQLQLANAFLDFFVSILGPTVKYMQSVQLKINKKKQEEENGNGEGKENGNGKRGGIKQNKKKSNPPNVKGGKVKGKKKGGKIINKINNEKKKLDLFATEKEEIINYEEFLSTMDIENQHFIKLISNTTSFINFMKLRENNITNGLVPVDIFEKISLSGNTMFQKRDIINDSKNTTRRNSFDKVLNQVNKNDITISAPTNYSNNISRQTLNQNKGINSNTKSNSDNNLNRNHNSLILDQNIINNNNNKDNNDEEDYLFVNLDDLSVDNRNLDFLFENKDKEILEKKVQLQIEDKNFHAKNNFSQIFNVNKDSDFIFDLDFYTLNEILDPKKSKQSLPDQISTGGKYKIVLNKNINQNNHLISFESTTFEESLL